MSTYNNTSDQTKHYGYCRDCSQYDTFGRYSAFIMLYNVVFLFIGVIFHNIIIAFCFLEVISGITLLVSEILLYNESITCKNANLNFCKGTF